MIDSRLTEIGRIPRSWKLRNVSELVDDGILAKPLDGNHGGIHPKHSDFTESGIPFIMASDLENGKVNIKNCKFISKEQADTLRKGFATTGDILLTHKATLGRTAIVGDIDTPFIILTPQVTYYRVVNRDMLDNRFLMYYFSSDVFQDTLFNHGSSGSTRNYIGITAQLDLPILVPPIEMQHAISAVLSSLDDKIDLLHRQNKTLESLAQTLFRHWFIDEAEDDWEECSLYDAIELVGGGTPKTSEEQYWNGDIPWLSGGDIASNHKDFVVNTEKKITEHGLKNSSAK